MHKFKYGGHFSKIIKANKIKYILMYFNNENDFLQAVYKSTMDESLGDGLKIKSQHELIGVEGTYKKKFGINRFKLPQQEKTSKSKDKFFDAPSDPISTIPRTLEGHKELDNLNKNFSKNLKEVNKDRQSLPSTKGKKVERSEENEEKINENKKRMGVSREKGKILTQNKQIIPKFPHKFGKFSRRSTLEFDRR
ncbi:hypothetical protein RhiirA1_390209 [Rhizophagus irregularis]|uniref:Uncharacterized protein n=1 Tax=Rhizophagus irregularis TaxID=588596 RepID=A0A2I1EUH3_9GLOM|nr:hypothetical protein RhiirA1_390209 [Rhizophagus irregularis]PKY25759.1 hypothetical protein RhiirB3_440830 [Rhizophagus irregularis]